MRADVPFGAFLSGGIDSSTVVALMQQSAEAPVKTFCIGNTLPGYDESSHAEAVARHLNCEHHTLIANPSDMLAIVPGGGPATGMSLSRTLRRFRRSWCRGSRATT